MCYIAAMLREWSLPIAIIPLTLLAAALSRFLLRRVSQEIRLPALRDLVPSSASIVYLVGLKFFLRAAPIPERSERWLDAGVDVLGIVIVLMLIRRVALAGIEWTARHERASPALSQQFIPLFKNLLTVLVIVVGGIAILRQFGYDAMSLLTALGVGSLAVGLAAKDTLSHMISGFTLIIDRNIRPGDHITVGDTSGEVEEIGLRTTKIRLGNGNVLIVPNADMVNTKILNRSLPTRSIACSTQFHVGYQVPFARVREVCQQALAGAPGVSQERGGSVQLTQLTDSGQRVSVGFWIKDLTDEAGVVSAVNERLLEALRAAGVPITFK